MADRTTTIYFDKAPFRAGLAPFPCCCFPFTCCGPPVIYTSQEKICADTCCPCDPAPCTGVQIWYSPCNCFGVRRGICCGDPVYQICKFPLVAGLSKEGAPKFLSALQAATKEYNAANGFDQGEMAVFQRIEKGALMVASVPATDMDR